MSLETNIIGRSIKGVKVVFTDGSERNYIGANSWTIGIGEGSSSAMGFIEHVVETTTRKWWGTSHAEEREVVAVVNLTVVRRIENFYEGD